ncbi:MAG: 2-dehydro-3-deoxy-6-phosphogalactonate aldolase [Herminiimonas sp.]|nr:2-dehydro-3-deoxy-6-phosphogalactonate aldolase [Herminiimonas sp.]
MLTLDTYPCPLIAILRGLAPSEAPGVGQILFDAGFRLLEVPLNRPGALEAIQALRRNAPSDALIGGGTMLTTNDVDAVSETGGQMMVSPNCDPEVIRHAVKKGMLALPGVATPTEAFQALAAGAHGLKLFPAEMIAPAVVKALRSVMPDKTWLLPVGGIGPDNMAAYIEAGANGFGIGGQLYQPGADHATLKRAAAAFMLARQAILQRS